MFASCEAIFLSTFVLIAQNRMSALGERRADLDLQINLLAEHEITRLIEMVEAIADHVGVERLPRQIIDELKQDVAPDKVLERMERAATPAEPDPAPKRTNAE